MNVTVGCRLLCLDRISHLLQTPMNYTSTNVKAVWRMLERSKIPLRLGMFSNRNMFKTTMFLFFLFFFLSTVFFLLICSVPNCEERDVYSKHCYHLLKHFQNLR